MRPGKGSPPTARRTALAAAAALLALGVLGAAALALPHGLLVDALLGSAALAAGLGWMGGCRAAKRAAAEHEARAERDRRLLRETAARAFRAQETERMRIARELQEETAQTLSALLLHLQVARTVPDAETRRRVLDEVRAALVEATDTVRRFARGLYPPALNDVGVAAAVQSYADTLSERGGPRITVIAGEVNGRLTRERELALYRIVQEALANAVRHAGARNVEVRLARRDGHVAASVEDDGRGFDVAAAEGAEPCLGLFGMRQRALYAGGTVTIDAAPGAGTRVVAELPVEDDAPRPALAIVPRPYPAAKAG